jgi:hypothetical protein
VAVRPSFDRTGRMSTCVRACSARVPRERRTAKGTHRIGQSDELISPFPSDALLAPPFPLLICQTQSRILWPVLFLVLVQPPSYDALLASLARAGIEARLVYDQEILLTRRRPPWRGFFWRRRGRIARGWRGRFIWWRRRWHGSSRRKGRSMIRRTSHRAMSGPRQPKKRKKRGG